MFLFCYYLLFILFNILIVYDSITHEIKKNHILTIGNCFIISDLHQKLGEH